MLFIYLFSICASVAFFFKKEKIKKKTFVTFARFMGWELVGGILISGVTLEICASVIIANAEKP